MLAVLSVSNDVDVFLMRGIGHDLAFAYYAHCLQIYEAAMPTFSVSFIT